MPSGSPAATAQAWLNSLGAGRLIVISPHLDDAVLSLAELLRAAAGRAEVVTLLTEAGPHQATTAWTRAAGFADAVEEHTGRRLEDLQAMQHLGCRYHHAGLGSGALTDDHIHQLLKLLLGEPVALQNNRVMVLLPAGCGGHLPDTPLQRLTKRALRKPFGSPAHPEHVEVRDQLWKALAAYPVQIGFYADLPYAWRQSNAAIQSDLASRFACELHEVQWPVDVEAKLTAVAHYPSQAALVLGDSPSYRRRVLSRPESLFMVSRPASTSHS